MKLLAFDVYSMYIIKNAMMQRDARNKFANTQMTLNILDSLGALHRARVLITLLLLTLIPKMLITCRHDTYTHIHTHGAGVVLYVQVTSSRLCTSIQTRYVVFEFCGDNNDDAIYDPSLFTTPLLTLPDVLSVIAPNVCFVIHIYGYWLLVIAFVKQYSNKSSLDL